MEYWKSLPTEEGAEFDKELVYSASDIEPQITYGTNPGLGTGISNFPCYMKFFVLPKICYVDLVDTEDGIKISSKMRLFPLYWA